MKRVVSQDVPVYVVLPPRTLLLDVAGPLEVLRKANFEQNRLRFAAHYIGASASVTVRSGSALPASRRCRNGFRMVPWSSSPAAPAISWRRRTGRAPRTRRRSADRGLARKAVRPGITLITICSGALLAARAGLLDGYSCTTHHACSAELSALAPRARVVDNRLYVEDGERLSSAGVTSGIDLMMHVVASLAGAAPAQAVARYLVVYLRRGGGDPQFRPGSKAATICIPPSTARKMRSPPNPPATGASMNCLGYRRRQPPPSFPPVQRTSGDEGHRLCQPPAHRAGARTSQRNSARYGEHRRTRGVRLHAAIPPRLEPSARIAAWPDAADAVDG